MNSNSAHLFGYYQREVCPGCLSTARDAKLETMSSPRAEELPYGGHGEFLSGYTKHRVFFSYFRCQSCQLLFCPRYFNPTQLDDLYKYQPENRADVPFIARLKTQQAYYDFLKRHHNLTGEYLEIGADIGLFTRHCAQDTIQKFYLYEPNLEVHQELHNCLPGKEVKIFSKHYTASDIGRECLSTAVIIHALDHILHPRNLLKDIHQNLKPGGCLLVVTHDEASLLSKLLKSKWPPFTLQHPHLFNPKTMKQLLISEGFEVLKIEKSVNYFPVTHLINGGFSALGLNIRVPEWSKWIVPLKLGNIATIARKRG